MMKKLTVVGVAIIFGAGLLLSGCATSAQRDAGVGALLGSALGAGTGALIAEDHGKGAIVGGVAGAAAGGLLGHEIGKAKDRDRAQDAAINQATRDANTVTINVPNNDGSFTPVQIVRRGNVWYGPQGEMYTSLPTPEQLKRRYGM